MEKIKPFEGGNDKQRDHLNEVVDAINALIDKVNAIEAWPEQTVCVHDNANENIIRVLVKSLIVQETVGPIECDCVSGQSFGDA